MTAIERGCPYSLSAGSRVASFNVYTDPDFVGYITDVTGLDMYGIRENAGVKTAGDGGYHGPFWRDRRPFTITGFIVPTTPVLARDQAQDKLAGVLGQCLRADGILNWTPADGVQRAVYFRTQQSLRFTKGQSNVEANFLLACVARDWRILAAARSSAGPTNGPSLPITVNTTNHGNADAAPIITVTGPINQPVITDTSSGKTFRFTGNVGAGQTLVIDLTGVYPSVLLGGVDWSNNIDPLNTNYTIGPQGESTDAWTLTSGSGTSGATAATSLKIQWNDSWH